MKHSPKARGPLRVLFGRRSDLHNGPREPAQEVVEPHFQHNHFPPGACPAHQDPRGPWWAQWARCWRRATETRRKRKPSNTKHWNLSATHKIDSAIRHSGAEAYKFSSKFASCKLFGKYLAFGCRLVRLRSTEQHFGVIFIILCLIIRMWIFRVCKPSDWHSRRRTLST